jgi:4-amino-4-deoxy-L-arabinose transferase-like glycosyltransferase
MGSEVPGSPGLRWRALPAAAAIAFALLALDAALEETPTVDEFAHVAAGHALLAHGHWNLYGKNPPLGRALLALPGTAFMDARVPDLREKPFGWGPWQYGHRFMQANAGRYFAIFTGARAVVIAAALVCAALVFAWTRQLFGERAAAIATALLLLQPTVLAHGHLATLDVLCAASVCASALALRRACVADSLPRMALAGVAWGAALLVKFSALLLLPAYGLLVLGLRGRRWRRAAVELAVLGGTALLVVNAGMGFRGTGVPLGEYRMASEFGRAVQAALPAALPVPLPLPWLRGFDAQKRDVEHAEFPSYLHGEWSRDGFWYYEAVALALKTPIPMLAMLLLWPLAPALRRLPRREVAFLVVPLLVLLVMLTAFNALNVGIRYLLPLAPFACVLVGALFAGGGRVPAALGLAAVAWHAGIALHAHPAYLSWFNLAAGGPAQGHRWLLDSNFDWGQDLYRLPAALERLGAKDEIALLYFGHVDPALYGIAYRLPGEGPERAVVAASVTYLEGFSYPALSPDGRRVRVAPDALAWLRDVDPVERLGSIWVFDLRGSPAR